MHFALRVARRDSSSRQDCESSPNALHTFSFTPCTAHERNATARADRGAAPGLLDIATGLHRRRRGRPRPVLNCGAPEIGRGGARSGRRRAMPVGHLRAPPDQPRALRVDAAPIARKQLNDLVVVAAAANHLVHARPRSAIDILLTRARPTSRARRGACALGSPRRPPGRGGRRDAARHAGGGACGGDAAVSPEPADARARRRALARRKRRRGRRGRSRRRRPPCPCSSLSSRRRTAAAREGALALDALCEARADVAADVCARRAVPAAARARSCAYAPRPAERCRRQRGARQRRRRATVLRHGVCSLDVLNCKG